MLDTLTTSAKLYLLVFIMTIFIIGVGGYGIYEMNTMKQNTQTLYIDRVICLQQLTKIRYSYAIDILSSIEQIQVYKLPPKQEEKKITQAQETIAITWNAYTHTYLTPEEKQLANQVAGLIRAAEIPIGSLKAILKENNLQALDTITSNQLYPSITPLLSKINALIELQVKISNEIYKSSDAIYIGSIKRSVFLILLCLVFAIPLSFYLIRNIRELITSLWVSNKRIMESEEKYRSLIEYAGDAIFIINKNALIVDVNYRASQLLGYTRQQLRQMNASDIYSVNDTETPVVEWNLLNKNKTILDVHSLRKKDGTKVEVEISRKLLANGEGCLDIVRDITERIEAEANLKALENAMAEERFKKLQEITDAVITAQEKERAFLGEELHDNINQLLAVSKLYLEVATSSGQIRKELIADSREYIIMAMEEIRKLSNTLLPPSLDGNSLQTVLTDLIEDIVHVKEINFIKDLATINEKLIPEKISVTVFRIVQEQLNNILKYAHAKKVTIALIQTEATLQLRIVDDGVGFDTSEKRNGIGLKNIASRVELLKGDVIINSSPGNGCELIVRFDIV